MCLREH
jgi:hypothetical protein